MFSALKINPNAFLEKLRKIEVAENLSNQKIRPSTQFFEIHLTTNITGQNNSPSSVLPLKNELKNQ